MTNPQTTADAPVFDRNSMLERIDGDESLLGIILDVFLEDAPNSMGAIERALAARDARGLRDAAHALKGACGNISAEELREAARDLEQIGDAGRIDDAPAAVARISAALDRLVTVLRRVRQEGDSRC
jgi:HPt (histidine-containing phosphotransfer) domain-containing protein